MTIDGYTQPGASPNTLAVGSDAVLRIELDGSLVGANLNGLTINAVNTTVRGLVINRFTDYGIQVSATGAVIRGNFVGTNVAGTAALGNNRGGAGNGGGIALFAGGATIGGTAPADRNLVSGNAAGFARGIETWESSGNTIQGNYVGTNAAGTAAVPNGAAGIALDGTAGVGSDNNTIGGSAAGAGNLCSGNQVEGIYASLGSDGNTLQGNIVGLNASATAALPNTDQGIKIQSAGNRIGGTTPAEGNVIAGNGAEGVRIEGVTATGNAILGNRIYANGGLGIDLGGDGVTENDGGDGDGGPNSQLNFPVITQATASGGSVSVGFQLDVPAGSYRIEFFRNPSGVDPLGNGEGEVFAGARTLTHPGGGAVAFTHYFAGQSGDRITATATFCTDGATCAAFGNTSEFGDAFPVSCCALSTTEAPGSTVTVTAAGQLEMVFNTLRGGGIDDFFDLAEDPSRALDLAGRDSLNLWGLFHSSMSVGGLLYTTGTNSSGAKLDVLEATPTRVKVRQEAFFQRVLPATAILPGVKAIGDYSVYGPRVAIGWNRRTTAAVLDQDNHPLEITAHREAAGVLNPMSFYSQSGSAFPLPPATISCWPSGRWRDRPVPAPTSSRSSTPTGRPRTPSPPRSMARTSAGGTTRSTRISPPASTSGGASSSTTSPRASSTTPISPSPPAAPTTGRPRPSPASGPAPSGRTRRRTRRPGGTSSTSRRLRTSSTWTPRAASRSRRRLGDDTVLPLLQDPPLAVVRRDALRHLDPDGPGAATPVTLVKDVHYRAAVKPVARAHFAQVLTYYASLQDPFAFASTPDVGTGGVANNGNDFPAARYGNGARFDADGDYLNIP